jgi:hypothetical protein
VIIWSVARSLSSRPIEKTVVSTDYFKTSLANLLFCYRRGDLVLLHLDFTGLPSAANWGGMGTDCRACEIHAPLGLKASTQENGATNLGAVGV